MNAQALIAEATEAGCRFIIDRERIGLRGDPAAVAELAPRLRPYKSALMHVLREHEQAARKGWRVCIPGRPPFGVICVQGCSRDEVLARYPAGTRADASR